MKLTKLLSLLAVGSFAFAGLMLAGSAKDYQVTGPVLEVTETMIAVQKGNDRWEIARDASTKGAADAKVGDKVTIHYTMTATKVDAKPVTKESKAAKAEGRSSPEAEASPKK